MTNKSKKGFIPQHNKLCVGFTLIELLIVIAILAILATIVLVVINPVQMIAQARDSQRIYDLNTLSNAVALYLTTVETPSLQGGAGLCGVNFWSSVVGVTNSEARFATGLVLTPSPSFTDAIDGTGWLAVNLNAISGGSPISRLPIDPINNTTYFYSYACNNDSKWFEFHGKMESCRYSYSNAGCVSPGSDNVENPNTYRYEVGNAPGLSL